MIEYRNHQHQGDAPPVEQSLTMLDPVETRLMRYLPNIYHDDLMMQRIIAILEEPYIQVDDFLDTLPEYLDPRMTPTHFLPFLAQWVDMRLHQRWSVERQRELIMKAVEIFSWRGTVTGLKLFLELLTGYECEVSQTFDGFQLGSAHCRMGRDSIMASGPDRTFIVTIHADVDETEVQLIRNVIDIEKPAHAAYVLKFEATLDLSALPGLSHE